MKKKLVALSLFLCLGVTAVISARSGCLSCSPPGVEVRNLTKSPTTVHVSFGAASVVLPGDWKFCKKTADLNCHFVLNAESIQPLSTGGKHLNATFSFDAPVGCGVTKAEIDVDNPAWYNTMDVSLVDGYSNNVSIESEAEDGSIVISGPPNGKTDNERTFGLFPYGCDICVERQKPSCGISKGKEGCKSGTQYNPDVPCQYQGPIMGGGQKIRIIFHGSETPL
jgi:hypothetical protein